MHAKERLPWTSVKLNFSEYDRGRIFVAQAHSLYTRSPIITVDSEWLGLPECETLR